MFNRRVQGALLVAATLAFMVAAGCASQGSAEPYSVTGNADQAEIREQARWTDQKGHYRPEWRAGVNTPAGYPKNIAE